MNKFSKMKVHWWTYNHCLFVHSRIKG